MARAYLSWKSWGGDLFREAVEKRRPILLLATTFCAEGAEKAPSELASEASTSLLRERVIPAWVDAELHPEVASQYGLRRFPSCALLTPEGALLCSFDPAACGDLKDLLDAAAVIASEVQGPPAPSPGTLLLPFLPGGEGSLERGLEVVEAVRERVERGLERQPEDDPDCWGQERAELIRFLLEYAKYTGSRKTLQRSLAALHQVAHSHLYDPVEGGFFGASGTEGGTYKRLDENARWLLLALAVAREPEGGFALPLARGILHYLQSRLLGKDGAFFSAQQADAGYYALAAEDRRRVTPPVVDDTVYLGGNAAAIAACCEGWRLLGEEAYLDAALRAHLFVRSQMAGPDGSMAHAFRESPTGFGYLEDAVEMGWAELALYRSTLDPRHLRALGALVRSVAERHQNPASPGFLNIRPFPRVTGVPLLPQVEFDANVRASGLLIHASAQLEDEALAAPARSALGSLLEAAPPGLASEARLGGVLLYALYPMAVLEVVSDGGDSQKRLVLERLRRMDLLHTIVTHRPPSKGEAMMALPRMIGRCGSQCREIPLEPEAKRTG